jgi:transposase-like protein
MKETLLPTPDELTLDEINQRFSTDETAREYIEAICWPRGATCPHCKNNNRKKLWKIEANEKKKVRSGLYQCAECKKQFTCTVGTIFEDSKIPLRKWLIAWYLISASKKGISSLQIQRILGLGSYRTALFMTHRIRHALKDPNVKKKLSGSEQHLKREHSIMFQKSTEHGNCVVDLSEKGVAFRRIAATK